MDTNELVTPESFFVLEDITIKKITVPDAIPVWGGKSMFIKKLSRGVQDLYLQRQFGTTKMKQDARAKQQEISAINIYGHDAWLCVQGICNAEGKLIFTDKDTARLNEKSGEAISWIANEIIQYSAMGVDAKVAKGEMTSSEALADEIKNS